MLRPQPVDIDADQGTLLHQPLPLDHDTVSTVGSAQHQRRKGVAQALMRRLAALVLERGYARLDWAVLDWNRDAIGFYEQLGAKPDPEHTLWRVDRAALEALATS